MVYILEIIHSHTFFILEHIFIDRSPAFREIQKVGDPFNLTDACVVKTMYNIPSSSFLYRRNGFDIIKPSQFNVSVVNNTVSFPSLYYKQTSIKVAGYYQCLLRLTGMPDIISEPIDVVFKGKKT